MTTFSGYENANSILNNEKRFNQDATGCWKLVAEITSDDYDSDHSVDATEEECTEIGKQNILFAECMWINGWREK